MELFKDKVIFGTNDNAKTIDLGLINKTYIRMIAKRLKQNNNQTQLSVYQGLGWTFGVNSVTMKYGVSKIHSETITLEQRDELAACLDNFLSPQQQPIIETEIQNKNY